MLKNEQIEELHALYERLTGQSVMLTVGRRCAWQAWGAAMADWIRHRGAKDVGIRRALELVVARRKTQWRDKPHTLSAVLKFKNLVEQTENCEEDLAASVACLRARAARPEPARAAVLRATGRDDAAAEGHATESAAVVMDRDAIAKMLADCKAGLGQ